MRSVGKPVGLAAGDYLEIAITLLEKEIILMVLVINVKDARRTPAEVINEM